MTTTKLFMSNTTQAVRLPKAVAFPDDVTEVDIVVDGEARILIPAGHRIDYLFARDVAVTGDFLRAREQPSAQERTGL